MPNFPHVAEYHNVTLEVFKSTIVPLHRPAVMRGLIADWPIVECANISVENLVSYLCAAHTGRKAILQHGDADIQGRFFYQEGDFSKLNYASETQTFANAIEHVLKQHYEPDGRVSYLANVSIREHMPNFFNENYNDILAPTLEPGIWVGNKTRIAPHFDVPDNIACCVSGERHFTLFPPEQISNLYVGPFEHTPAGQPISLVDVKHPDLQHFPKYKEAQQHALCAELSPGDAIYIPSLWWHGVESLSPFNVLLSYFHDATPQYLGAAFPSLIHSLLTIRHLPIEKKRAWQAYFQHYVFSEDSLHSHIPAQHKGILHKPSPEQAHLIREQLMSALTTS